VEIIIDIVPVVSPTFRRAKIQPILNPDVIDLTRVEDKRKLASYRLCYACGTKHLTGLCPLKRSGYERCGLCGLAHYGASQRRICPHLRSETQVRLMIDALKVSTEPREHIQLARAYLRGVIGDLVRRKRSAQDKNVVANAAASGSLVPQQQGLVLTSNPNDPSAFYQKSPYFPQPVSYDNSFDQESQPMDS
jgi:chromodomain-helicase-DNA-binding protein 4